MGVSGGGGVYFWVGVSGRVSGSVGASVRGWAWMRAFLCGGTFVYVKSPVFVCRHLWGQVFMYACVCV